MYNMMDDKNWEFFVTFIFIIFKFSLFQYYKILLIYKTFYSTINLVKSNNYNSK